MTHKSTTLSERFGPTLKENGLVGKMRVHQGWWRTNVLHQEPGLHPIKATENICNTIIGGELTGSNFLTQNALRAARETLELRVENKLGIIEIGRLFNNLMSSQPLCFNFFGEIYADLTFGLKVLKTFYPDLTKLKSVKFEFSPRENYTRDSSAFDVAFEVESSEKTGLIGFECKYTDTFSFRPSNSPINYGDMQGDEKNKNHDTYLNIYNKSKERFASPYYEFVRSKDFNQLFRNQLIAEALLQNKKIDFVRTGLFCYQEDFDALKTGNSFKSMLTAPDSFQVLTYADFIRNVQQLDIEWKYREWTMLLWARYCGTILSNETILQLNA